ncbi:hypothetical protein Taro_025717 [Colocasia esculenta]|uniref:Uncharacterized protein n=1 Tax=Colocasia esculenta TaxID=4460 RepID=A0A843VAY3_COLES|nr:hypothetical protein [Colocasia esculenta]
MQNCIHLLQNAQFEFSVMFQRPALSQKLSTYLMTRHDLSSSRISFFKMIQQLEPDKHKGASFEVDIERGMLRRRAKGLKEFFYIAGGNWVQKDTSIQQSPMNISNHAVGREGTRRMNSRVLRNWPFKNPYRSGSTCSLVCGHVCSTSGGSTMSSSSNWRLSHQDMNMEEKAS